MARDALNHGLSVCIDRQNFDARCVLRPALSQLWPHSAHLTPHRQRATWIDIAGEFPGTVVHVIVFDTPYEVSG